MVEMEKSTNNNLCKAHSGVIERLNDCEGSLKMIWAKLGSFEKMAFGALIALILNLVVVIFIASQIVR